MMNAYYVKVIEWEYNSFNHFDEDYTDYMGYVNREVERQLTNISDWH